MKITVITKKEVEVKYVEINVEIDTPEAIIVNGSECVNTDQIPMMKDHQWKPVIDIESGSLLNWPIDTTASFHIKARDSGAYYLLDESLDPIASIEEDYVPSGLCHGDTGYGDYIIFDVNESGSIEGYEKGIDPEDWTEDNDD